jgi:protocatechuate 3,4-dioxygenase beta subunit
MKLRPTPHDVSRVRRRVLQGAGLLLVAGAARAADALRATPRVSEGPFYPRDKPADSDADLTQVAGQNARAKGQVLYVVGRVLDTNGKPLPAASIELWQANALGRYMHPADGDASGALDPGFQGYGRLASGGDGRFRIKTIKPAPYPGRTPHIHFIVAGGKARLTTQMFFEGEAGNERDGLWRWLGAADRRAATGQFVDRESDMESGALAVRWDIVLAG